ncbi:hypothetical protein FXF51_02000 [Nonomuraea sp. PA05]|uniref:hypothetical protein n=1 Tax=Nonomuraea sp. PA05 TaxID=2604466 RepID=UPI0011D492C1|nr:hypothetical protein [Nonomuraea sp. PA05]TYB71233.1 hypothetical protein FXF51_02000 [Nonomuraea sp. PA05]
MADFTCNIALGRAVELVNRVKTGDPAGSSLIVVALATSGLESDAVLRDKDTLADLVAGTTNEVPVGNGYARKSIVAADLNPVAPDDVNDRTDLDIPDQTWASVLAASGGWSKLVICYKPAAASTDAQIVPLTCHDFVIAPDGTDIVAQISATGFFRAAPL